MASPKKKWLRMKAAENAAAAAEAAKVAEAQRVEVQVNVAALEAARRAAVTKAAAAALTPTNRAVRSSISED
jgi:hypothetical protein